MVILIKQKACKSSSIKTLQGAQEKYAEVKQNPSISLNRNDNSTV